MTLLIHLNLFLVLTLLLLLLLFTVLLLHLATMPHHASTSRRKPSTLSQPGNNLQLALLQHAAYHLQKPLIHPSRIYAALHLFRSINYRISVLNPVMPNVQQDGGLAQMFRMKRHIEWSLYGGESLNALAKRSRTFSEFMLCSVASDATFDALVILIETALGKLKMESHMITIFGLDLSSINARYLEHRFRITVEMLPGLHFDKQTPDALGPFAMLSCPCKACLYVHPDSLLNDLDILKQETEALITFIQSPHQSSTSFHGAAAIDKLVMPGIVTGRTSPVFNLAYVRDKKAIRNGLLAANAMMLNGAYQAVNLGPSDSWWMGMELVGIRYRVIGEPALVGIIQDNHLCGVWGAVHSGKLIIADHAYKHLKHAPISHYHLQRKNVSGRACTMLRSTPTALKQPIYKLLVI